MWSFSRSWEGSSTNIRRSGKRKRFRKLEKRPAAGAPVGPWWRIWEDSPQQVAREVRGPDTQELTTRAPNDDPALRGESGVEMVTTGNWKRKSTVSIRENTKQCAEQSQSLVIVNDSVTNIYITRVQETWSNQSYVPSTLGAPAGTEKLGGVWWDTKGQTRAACAGP